MAHVQNSPSASEHLIVAQHGKSDYTIVIGDSATPPERRAAEELQAYLSRATGATIPIAEDGGELPSKAIVVGANRHTSDLVSEAADGVLGAEEHVVRSVGDHIVIVGGSPHGTLYGAYRFLEEVVGCRWYTRDVQHVPTLDALDVSALDIRRKPAMEYREPFFGEAFDADWSVRNYSNSSHAGLVDEHGGKVRYGSQAFVHTFEVLMPVAEYFAEHPEYYSLIDGKRTDDHTQLCLTNPDVLEIVIEGVRKWIRDEPDATIFSVSQNDWTNPCQCDACREIDEREGSPIGSILTFVNQVAEAIEEESAHVAIDTLAYWYSRKPPKTIRPRPNVIVRLCSIECCFSHPLDTCPENASFVEDIRQWSTMCNRLYIWDYVTNFGCYIMPWPNLGVLGPNVRFFAQHNVVGLFEQGSYSSGGGGELAELRSYVLAKLLWDPDTDERAVQDEFIDGVYGAAAPLMREYIDLVQEPAADPGMHMHIFEDIDEGHIRQDIIRRGDALLEQAEAAAESEDVRQRVEKARLPVWYVLIRRMDEDDPARAKLIERFLAVTKREGIVDMGEGRSVEKWIADGAQKPAN